MKKKLKLANLKQKEFSQEKWSKVRGGTKANCSCSCPGEVSASNDAVDSYTSNN